MKEWGWTQWGLCWKQEGGVDVSGCISKWTEENNRLGAGRGAEISQVTGERGRASNRCGWFTAS